MPKPKYVAYSITLIGVMGVSAITPGLPEIARAFNINSVKASLLITAFTLPGIFFSPVTGFMADKFGRKLVISTSIFIFGFSGIICAFSNFETMVLLRIIQGISASALVALSTTIIGDAYTGLERQKIIGYNASILTVGIAFYQLFGGFLSHFGWNYPFYIFLLAFPVGFFVLFSKLPDVKESFNFLDVINYLNRDMLTLFFFGFIAYSLLYGTFLAYLPFVIYKIGGSSIIVGIIQAIMSLSTAFFAANLTRISKKLKEKIISVGYIAYTTSLIIIFFSLLMKCELCLVLSSIVFGYAQGTVLPTLQHSIVSMTEKDGRATIMSIYGSISKLGQTFGPIFYGMFNLDIVYIVGATIAITSAVTSKQVLKMKHYFQ